MTDIGPEVSRSFAGDEHGTAEWAALAESVEQALASIAQRYEQATAALQALLDEHTRHGASRGDDDRAGPIV